jgi:adenylate kinase
MSLSITPTAATEWPALIVVAGRPGSGKGTQCAQIAADLGVAHFSLGEALRQEVDERTQLGLRVHPFLGAGRLVPDHFVFELIGARLARQDAPAVVLDGFPRTLGQAEMLERVEPGAVALALLLAVPLPIVVERLRSRGRADDDEYALRERLASFERETRPMLAWYERRGVLASVDANRPQADVTVAVETLVGPFLAAVRQPAGHLQSR